MRCARRKRRGAGIKSGPHRRQPLAPDAAAIAQNGAPALRRVPAEKAVLTFAAHFRWLILAFHKALPLGGVRCGTSLPEKRATLSVKAGVSTLRVNFKSQKPNFKTSKLQTRTVAQSPIESALLEFGICLEFGFWDLDFFTKLTPHLQRQLCCLTSPFPRPDAHGAVQAI